MGIMDFVRGGVREMMVARPDAQKHLIVWKHPDPTIPAFAQLTVDLDECAVFFKSGPQPTVNVLPPGRHTLSTQNIPFLSNFVDTFTGGNVFQAEVFFVKTQPVRNLKFGGQLMSMRDPELDLRVTPRARGTYSLAVVDPIRFIIGYTGQAAQGDNEAIAQWFMQRMFLGLGKSLGGFLKSGQTTFMDLGTVGPDLAAAIVRECPDFTEIGVRILELGELVISLNEQDQRRVDEMQDQIAGAKIAARKAQIGIAQAQAEAQQRQFGIDQAGGWQPYAVGQAMLGAGQGMAQGGDASNVAGLGAQMAVGVGMAQWMQPPAQPQPPPAQAAPASGGGRVTCGKCSAQVPSGKFCQECGGPLAAPKKFCTSCGTEVGGKFCASCGQAAP